jgi:homogentisate 1,2-dioxygenase
MLDRMAVGELPAKHHITLTGADGALRYEECFTRDGFDGPYSILYHRERPHLHAPAPVRHGWSLPGAPVAAPLRKRHVQTQQLAATALPPVDARIPLIYNSDVVVSVLKPGAPDPVYLVNGDGDELLYIFEGGGLLRTPFGDLRFERDDYVAIPKAVPHRLIPDAGPQYWLSLEVNDLHLLKQWRNAAGQLRMDAPYTHRDFRRPTFVGPQDEGLRDLLVKRGNAFHAFTVPTSPLDVVGWDGTVYPWAFPILAFQPRVGLTHLPPTWHGTFGARGGLICSFVPRPVDFHPNAIPCPYPHSSVDCDELLFYCRGNFTSRRGVGPGSMSIHPAGIPHGPHPGAYEASIGTRDTTELAVMLDTFQPMHLTDAARGVEDGGYQASFVG